jgi:type VI secretion system secreted protein VgrG
LAIAVVGIPKTIDNDVMYIRRTFGVSTATEVARKVLDSLAALNAQLATVKIDVAIFSLKNAPLKISTTGLKIAQKGMLIATGGLAAKFKVLTLVV